MPKIKPRHVLCILGQWSDWDAVEAVVEEVGGRGFELDREYSLFASDDRMMNAFEYSYDRVAPSMTEADWQAVEDHTAVAYVLSPPIPKKNAYNISGQALLLTAALLRQGGVAAKNESAGLAHGRDHWLELAEKYAQAKKEDDSFTLGSALYRAWVRRPLMSDDDEWLYTCGMHLLGLRDLEIDSDQDMGSALQWIDLAGLYLAADQPTRPILDGEGFRLSDSGPRRIMRFHPCERYDEDRLFFNPYGYIRLEDENGRQRLPPAKSP